MRVQLCWSTTQDDINDSMHHTELMTIKEEMDIYNYKTCVEQNIVRAHLRKFKGYHWMVHKTLKGYEEND